MALHPTGVRSGWRACYGLVLPAVVAMWLSLLSPWVALGQLATSTIQTGAPPAWVEMTDTERGTESDSSEDARGQLLTLFETQANPASAETFVHVVKEITTEAGVRNGANLEFRWDPSFQELTIHQITIHRGMQRIDRLEPAKFKIIQQETDLNLQIYNGALSALLFLEDVRIGDRIEFSYTERGENPSLKGRYSDSFLMGWPVPVRHRRVRLLWPEGRRLNFRAHGTNVEPELHHHGSIKEYIWEQRRVPAIAVEDRVPAWFPAYPWIQVSDFAGWPDVAAWAAGLFACTNLDSRELKEEVAKLERPYATPEQTVQSALEFAQNDIRYLGIEFGPNSYRPTDPVTVLHRRFGDCKDKAVLLCALLRGLGYEADPVLVATGFRRKLTELVPALGDFDHVIVRVTAAGVVYWMDPTRSYQRGPLSQRYRPDYGFGLAARQGETGLVSIPVSDAGLPETLTSEVVRIGNQKAPAYLSVTTTFKGFDAEWMRAAITSGGRDQLAKSYLNDYAQRYPGITASAPMTIEDAHDRDIVTISHTYAITNFWVLSTDKQKYDCQFYPLGIHTWIEKPTSVVRSMPLEVFFPRQREVHTRLELPREFKLTNLTNTIADAASELRVTRTHRGRTVWLDYEFKTLTNLVPASLATEHLGTLDRMENALGYSLMWQNLEIPEGTSQVNWRILLLGTVYAVFIGAGAGLLCRYPFRVPYGASSTAPPIPDSELSGLGGWLILVGIGVVVGPLSLLSQLTKSFHTFSPWNWQSLTHPGGVSYQPAWAPVLTFELLGHITMLILSVFAMALFFQKRRIFPRWFIALLLFHVIFVLGDLIGVQFLKTGSDVTSEKALKNVMQSMVGCAIWVPYMCVSRRVKATFVR